MPQTLRRAASIVLLAAFIAGCGGESGPTALDLSHVPSDQLGAVQAGNYVFRTRADWESFWAAHPHAGYPARQIPAVDFARDAVAGVFAGAKGRCNRLDIVSGSVFQGRVTLRYRVSTFGAGTPSSCIGSDPFVLNLADLVRVPSDSAQVIFEAE